jgi:hypothetical protein
MIMESEKFAADYLGGVLVITDKTSNTLHSVSLRDANCHNITRKQFLACVKSHGLDRACSTFKKLATKEAAV